METTQRQPYKLVKFTPAFQASAGLLTLRSSSPKTQRYAFFKEFKMLKNILLFLVLLSLTSCASSTSNRLYERAESEQDRAYRIGQEKGTPDNIKAAESANQNAKKSRGQAINNQFPLIEILFEILKSKNSSKT